MTGAKGVIPKGKRQRKGTDGAGDSAPVALADQGRLVRWLAGTIVLLIAAAILYALFSSPQMGWPTVRRYLLSVPIVGGVETTLELTVICEVVGIVVGTVLAGMRLSPNPILNRMAAAYLWFFRGTPILVQLIFWYNLAALLPHIGIGALSVKTNILISGFSAAIFGLGLHEAALMSEIVRGGIQAVPAGQVEAGQAVGMTKAQVMRRIVLPQAIRLIIPPTGNDLIMMLKNTSLVAFIAGGDLLTQATNISAQNFQVIPLLVVATLWYLACVSVATVGQRYLERHLNRGVRR